MTQWHMLKHELKFEVRLDDAVPLIERHAVQGTVAGDAGVVDQNVNGTEIADYFLQRFGALPVIRYVEFVSRDPGLPGEAFGRFVVSGVGRRDRVSGILQTHGDGFADAAGAARHNCYA